MPPSATTPAAPSGCRVPAAGGTGSCGSCSRRSSRAPRTTPTSSSRARQPAPACRLAPSGCRAPSTAPCTPGSCRARCRTRSSERATRRRSVDLPLEPLPVGRPELELLQLAGRRPRQLGTELHRRGGLVAGRPLLAPRDQLGLGRLGARSQDDQCLDRLPPLLA